MATTESGNSVAEAWSRAEQAIKRAEVLQGDLIVPATAELRFAGRSLVDSMGAKSEEERIRLERDALFHCHRARRDALVAQAVYLNNVASKMTTMRFADSTLAESAKAFMVLASLTRNELVHKANDQGEDASGWDRLEVLTDDAIGRYQAIRFDVELSKRPSSIQVRIGSFAMSIASESLRTIVALIAAAFLASLGARLFDEHLTRQAASILDTLFRH